MREGPVAGTEGTEVPVAAAPESLEPGNAVDAATIGPSATTATVEEWGDWMMEVMEVIVLFVEIATRMWYTLF